jgi:predicted metal-dependent enzyme (double-stranded beta helix superfamily)
VATFDCDQFVADCISTLKDADPVPGLTEVVERAVAAPSEIISRFPLPLDPEDDGILYRSADLLVSTAIFPRGFTTGIHNHTVEAVIGVWTGVEDNFLYERAPSGITALQPKRIETGQVLVLERDAIHDVHVPTSTWSGALHVYLGDIFEASRSEWADAAGEESVFDGANLERRWAAAAGQTGLLAS